MAAFRQSSSAIQAAQQHQPPRGRSAALRVGPPSRFLSPTEVPAQQLPGLRGPLLDLLDPEELLIDLSSPPPSPSEAAVRHGIADLFAFSPPLSPSTRGAEPESTAASASAQPAEDTSPTVADRTPKTDADNTSTNVTTSSATTARAQPQPTHDAEENHPEGDRLDTDPHSPEPRPQGQDVAGEDLAAYRHHAEPDTSAPRSQGQHDVEEDSSATEAYRHHTDPHLPAPRSQGQEADMDLFSEDPPSISPISPLPGPVFPVTPERRAQPALLVPGPVVSTTPERRVRPAMLVTPPSRSRREVVGVWVNTLPPPADQTSAEQLGLEAPPPPRPQPPPVAAGPLGRSPVPRRPAAVQSAQRQVEDFDPDFIRRPLWRTTQPGQVDDSDSDDMYARSLRRSTDQPPHTTRGRGARLAALPAAGPQVEAGSRWSSPNSSHSPE